MIAVAGFNSAIDTVADADEVRAGAVIRLSSVAAYPGGKGVHVAQTCAMLGEAVRLVGLVDDAHAPLFARVLSARAVDFRGVRVDGRLRTCYAIRDAAGAVTELLEPGPAIDASIAASLEEAFLVACEGCRVAVLSGSLPAVRGAEADADADVDVYARLVARLRDRVPHVIVDTSGPALAQAIAAGPTLVKPNRDEAARLVGRALTTTSDAFDAAREIASHGIAIVIVSLGAEGAVACWDGRLARLEVPVREGSAVGSGDCFVAGLAVALARGACAEEALRLAAACGAANLLTREPGWAVRADVERLLPDVRVTWA